MDYDGYAGEYAQVRWAFPWILEPLARAVTATPPHSAVLEAGCGTCNYANALAERFDDRRFHGFDRSGEMLAGARSRSHKVALVRADAESSFPYQDHVFELIYFVDVIHHIVKLSTLFAESSRTLLRDGTLIIVTDSEEDIRSRSLTHYFPELLNLELERYPQIGELHAAARGSGLQSVRSEPAEGFIDLTPEFLNQLERKGSSGLRLIAPEAHARGMERLREAYRKGERWFSCYTVLHYTL